jgi:polyribonucleotide nucleotidyltransferase
VIDIASDDVSQASKLQKPESEPSLLSPKSVKCIMGTVKNIVPFGAFIEIMPGKEGLLHISEIDWRRIEKVEDVLTTGEKIEVKLIDVDNKTGKLKLSRKALDP